MNVLVTGANGLLGHQVVMELLKRQHTVHLIVRSTQNIYFDISSVKVFEGNFTDYTLLSQAARGCDAIIHIAAVTATNLLKADDYRNINVEGTARVIRAANESGIRTIVYISSANTIGFGNEQLPADERFPIQYPFSASFYAQSKLESEQLLVEASKQPDKHVVIINPAFMIGAYDTKPSSGKLILMGYNRRILFIPKGGKNFVPARDVAVAVCNALTRGRNGERYLASGINLSFKEYYTLQKQAGSYSQWIFELPGFLLLSIAKIGDLLRRLGIKSDLSTRNIRQLLIREYYSNRKGKNELNLPETDLKIAVQEAIDWFKEHNRI
ncbi:MAG: NAD-dependent epimerase/dehydratase family protein [Bacteroidota bacterium]|nr:NAD-dependent epimerase/dehydratase family protein [Bacteroidota bacterium]